ncbi:MAG: Ig-like domain-containing protein [Planctomycetota bacterium]|jgi:hypothetical protein
MKRTAAVSAAAALAVALAVTLLPLGAAAGPDADPAISYVSSTVKGKTVTVKLMMMDADGSNPTEVYTGGLWAGGGAGWSPDATRLAFRSADHETRTEGLHTVNVDGTGLAMLIEAKDGRSPVWSPTEVPGVGGDKARIAFVARDLEPGSRPDIFLVDPDGSDLVRLTNTPTLAEKSLTWSPSGERLAFKVYDFETTEVNDLWGVYDFVTDTYEVKEHEGVLADAGVYQPSWAKTQESKIAWSVWAGTSYDIWVVDLDDPENPLQLTDTADKNEMNPTWSADDTEIAFGRSWQTNKGLDYDIAVVSATDGSNLRVLAGDASNPTWRREIPAGPTVTITSPSDGSVVWGSVTLAADASGEEAITDVEFFVDGESVGVDDTSPYSITWNSSTVGDGQVDVSAVATDLAGLTGNDVVSVTVDNVDDPPSVTITAPQAGSTVSGTAVTIAAVASDDGSVVQVQFFVDGVPVGTDMTSPYQVTWNSTTVADGSHTITATATDDTAQTASHNVPINVLNTAPPFTVASINPNTMNAGSSVNVTVLGTGFVAGSTLTFENGTGGTPTASNVVVMSATTITARVSVSNSGPRGTRTWDVVVKKPTGQTARLVGGFKVVK